MYINPSQYDQIDPHDQETTPYVPCSGIHSPEIAQVRKRDRSRALTKTSCSAQYTIPSSLKAACIFLLQITILQQTTPQTKLLTINQCQDKPQIFDDNHNICILFLLSVWNTANLVSGAVGIAVTLVDVRVPDRCR